MVRHLQEHGLRAEAFQTEYGDDVVEADVQPPAEGASIHARPGLTGPPTIHGFEVEGGGGAGHTPLPHSAHGHFASPRRGAGQQ